MKQIITRAPVLTNFNNEKQIIIQTDSSKNGIECILLQDEKPVSFASKSLTECEIRYGQIEKEFLAILFACKKFKQYIYGKKVIIHTDHLPLVSIMKNEPDKRKIAIFLNIIGEEAVELFNTFKFTAGDENKLDKVMQAFEKYCQPNKNILYSRFLFYNKKQKQCEEFDCFLKGVKTLIKPCEFKHEEEMLRDKIVLDANDKETQLLD